MGRKLCGCCGEIKDSKEFYKSPKIKEEYIFLCKNCCGQKLKEYENILDKKSAAFWLVLSEIGIPFISEIWKIVETYPSAGRRGKDYLLLYLKTLIEDGRLVNGFWESDVMLDDLIQIKKDEIVPKQELNLEEERKIWGNFYVDINTKQLDRGSYEFLNKTYEEYTSELLDIDVNLEKRFRDLAKCELRLRKANEINDGTEISRAQESLNKQLNLLKMNDFSINQKDERQKFIDRIAWMIEETEPAEEEDRAKYSDIAGYEKIYNSWMRSMKNILTGDTIYPDIPIEEE